MNYKAIIFSIIFVTILGCSHKDISLGHDLKAKYIFYFIGDGMGCALLHGTQLFLAEQEGRIGANELSFTNFPVHNTAITHSALNVITCSAAGATALSCGERTSNGTIGMDICHTRSLNNISQLANSAGYAVGIVTSVSIDHATPAAFYAHQPRRDMNYAIACNGANSEVTVLGGSGFLSPLPESGSQDSSIYNLLKKNGYLLAYGKDAYIDNCAHAGKVVLLPDANADTVSLKYAINRTHSDVKLSDMVEASIEVLEKQGENGFFLMAEGGKIDWACHNNDAATAIRETIDLSDAVAVALEFYKRYPKETLIVVTADHETGGVSLGTKGYDLNLSLLGEQKSSAERISTIINEMHVTDGHVSWDRVMDTLQIHLGSGIGECSLNQMGELKDLYEEQFGGRENVSSARRNHYAIINPIVQKAIDIQNQNAGIGWSTLQHSAAPVPFFAIGAGAHRFMGKQLYNTDIFTNLIDAAGWK